MADEAETKKRPLTAKQQAFVSAYLTNGFNATQAAITAGYSKKNARQIGNENLTKLDIAKPVRQELDNLRTHALLTKEGRLERIIKHVEAIERQMEEAQYLQQDLKVSAKGEAYEVSYFDKARHDAFLRSLDDIAKEMGDRRQKVDISFDPTKLSDEELAKIASGGQ